MDETPDTPIGPSRPHDHETVNGAMSLSSMKPLMEFRGHCVMFMIVLTDFYENTSLVARSLTRKPSNCGASVDRVDEIERISE
jgi:hypothetical protein